MTALAQTADGYLWLGTPEGLIRFDGSRFDLYGPWNISALDDPRISALWVDDTGVLWVGLGSGSGARLEADGSWHHLGGSEAPIKHFARDDQGSIWVGTDRGIARLVSDSIRFDVSETDTTPRSVINLIAQDSGRLLTVFTRGGLIKQSNQNKRWTSTSINSHIPHPISAVSVLNDGSYAIGTSKGLQIIDIESDSSVLITLKSDLRYSPIITSLVQDAQGNLWIGTLASGLYSWTPNAEHAVRVEHLQIGMIQALLIDHDDALWIASDQSGLTRLERTGIFTLDEQAGLRDLHVRTVCVDAAGQLWAGSNSGDLLRLIDDLVVERFRLAGAVLSLLSPEKGVLLAGTEHTLYLLKQEQHGDWNIIDQKMLQEPIVSMVASEGHSIIVATEKQLFNLDQEYEILQLHKFSEPASAKIRMLTILPDGTLRVATEKGLFRMEGSHLIKMKLSVDNVDVDILYIYSDKDYGLWIGTAGKGVALWENDTEFPLWPDTRAGHVEPYVFSIHKQSDKRIWLSGYRGVTSEVDSLIFGNRARQATLWEGYGESSGMRSPECNSSGGGALAIGEGGVFYYPTMRGIVRVDPSALAKRELTPIPIIQEVLVDGKSVEVNSIMKKRFSDIQFLEVRFSGIAFRTPEKMQFRYMLDGFDESWNLAISQKEAAGLYVNLPPGQYTFRVQARFQGGEWTVDEVRQEFQITETGQWPGRLTIIILVLFVLAVGFWKYKTTPAKAAKKYSTSALKPETSEAVSARLNKLITEEHIYLDANLTLQKLAKHLKIHYNYLSRILNENYGKSYNDFINGYRIEAAKDLLTDPSASDRTILEILLATGFFTKSVFNSAFKKATGMTPSQYRKIHS